MFDICFQIWSTKLYRLTFKDTINLPKLLSFLLSCTHLKAALKSFRLDLNYALILRAFIIWQFSVLSHVKFVCLSSYTVTDIITYGDKLMFYFVVIIISLHLHIHNYMYIHLINIPLKDLFLKCYWSQLCQSLSTRH